MTNVKPMTLVMEKVEHTCIDQRDSKEPGFREEIGGHDHQLHLPVIL